MQPVNDVSQDNNVIYIESDDHQESLTESANYEGNELEQPKLASEVTLAKQVAARNNDQSSLLYGETGTTQPASSGAQQTSAMSMAQMPSPSNADGGLQVPGVKQGDKILSEIAEEDSISMISDRPRRFKPSDCVTPVDPVTNSFMANQAREGQQNFTHSRLKETANRAAAEPVSNFAQPAAHQQNASAPGTGRTPNKPNPYATGDEHPPASGTSGKNTAHSGSSSTAMPQQRQPKQSTYMNKTGGATNDPTAGDGEGKDAGKNTRNQRPTSTGQQKRSSSGQGTRVHLNQGGTLHQLIEQNQQHQMRSRQAKNIGYGADKGVSQTMPALNSRDTNASSSTNAYGNMVGGAFANAGSSAQTGHTALSASTKHSQSQLGHAHGSGGGHPGQAHQSLMHSLGAQQNSQSQQVMPSLTEATLADRQNSSSALYQVSGAANSSKPRRSSN